MTQTNFTDDIVIQGSQDIAQLQVKASSTQTQPLQNWQDNSSNLLVQVTSDGKLQLGDPGLVSIPTALIEANQSVTLPSPKPQRGWHSIGKFSGPITSPLTWVVNELRLLATGGLSGLHVGQRSQLTVDSSTVNATGAELRAGDFMVSNAAGISGNAVGKATGSRSTASNATSAYLTTAVGVEGAISNDTSGNVAQANVFSAIVPVNNGVFTNLAAFNMAALPAMTGTIGTLYGLQLPDLTQGTIANYALYTGKGIAHLGDLLETPLLSSKPSGIPPANFVRLYAKLNGATPQLYALNNAGVESQLGSSTGTVTSIGLSLPGMFTVSGSPVTTSGTLTATMANQPANTLWSGPSSGAAAPPTFRALTATDLSTALTAPPPIGTLTPSTGAFSSVAINQPNPTALLHLKGSINGPQAIIETTSTATSWLEFRDGNASQHRMALAMGLTTPTDGKFGIYDAASAAQRLTVDTNGRIGINQSTPSAMLEIDSNAAATKGLIVKGAASQTANLQEWQNSSGTYLAAVDSAGRVYNTETITALNGNAVGLNFSNIDTTETDINWNINNNLRWQVYVYGSGASSNWSVRAFNATGTYLGNWLSIDNASGTTTLAGNLKTTAVIDTSAVLSASSIPVGATIAYSVGSTSHAGNIIITTSGSVNPQGLATFSFITAFANKPGAAISLIGQNPYGIYLSALGSNFFQLANATVIPAGQTITVSYVIIGATS